MRELIIEAENGLHMRPVAKVVKIASEYPGEITFQKGEKTANAKSTMKILGLGVTKGDTLVIKAEGDGAEEIEEKIYNCLAGIE